MPKSSLRFAHTNYSPLRKCWLARNEGVSSWHQREYQIQLARTERQQHRVS